MDRIQDEYIEKYLAEKDLNLTATLDAKSAYKKADFVVIAAPTNYDSVPLVYTCYYQSQRKISLNFSVVFTSKEQADGFKGICVRWE